MKRRLSGRLRHYTPVRLGLWAYYRIGRLSMASGHEKPEKAQPFWQIAAVAATHCGAGCTLGDVVSEWFAVGFPITLFGEKIFISGYWISRQHMSSALCSSTSRLFQCDSFNL